MKKTIAILSALVLAVLCCVTVQAETEDVIRFLDIPWGSDIETVCQAMLDAGWINEEGVERFESIKTKALQARMGGRAGSYIPQFSWEDGHIVGNDRDGSKNAVSGMLMSDMVVKEWMGVRVHHIELIFALEGSTEKLLTVNISLIASREDLTPEFEKIYGKPDDVNEERRNAAYWEGQKGTVLYYIGNYVIFTLKDAKERADSAVMEIIETPTPVPTPEPTPEPTPVPDLGETDVMSFIKKGELTFLDIPWNTDPTTAADRMAALGFFTQETRDNLQEMKTDYAFGLSKSRSYWTSLFPMNDMWEAYFLSPGKCEFTKTCCGYPISAVTVSFKKDGDRPLLKCVKINCFDVGDAESVIWAAKTLIEGALGEGTNWYGSWYWEGENDSVIYLSGSGDSFSVSFGISTDEK